jgi:hypothetical protein
MRYSIFIPIGQVLWEHDIWQPSWVIMVFWVEMSGSQYMRACLFSLFRTNLCVVLECYRVVLCKAIIRSNKNINEISTQHVFISLCPSLPALCPRPLGLSFLLSYFPWLSYARASTLNLPPLAVFYSGLFSTLLPFLSWLLCFCLTFWLTIWPIHWKESSTLSPVCYTLNMFVCE